MLTAACDPMLCPIHAFRYTAAELVQLAEELDLGPSADRFQEAQRAWLTGRSTPGSGNSTPAPTASPPSAAKKVAKLGATLLVKAWIPFTIVAVRQLRHYFGAISHAFSSSTLAHPRRVAHAF